MSSLSDILTAAKNVVTAVNGVAQTYLNVQGTLNSSGITAAKLVKSGTGRISSVSVIVAGSANGFVYDSNSLSITSAPLYVIPQTVGVYFVNMPASLGIVVAPGTGQTITVSYS
jgi:hypothetical protein